MTDAIDRRLIKCPTCLGSGKEPSAIVSVRTHCSDCGGGGYFTRGTPTRLMTISEFIAATKEQQP